MTHQIIYDDNTRPSSHIYDGYTFFVTGKTGHRTKDGMKGWEYSSRYTDPAYGTMEARMWIYEDGSSMID